MHISFTVTQASSFRSFHVCFVIPGSKTNTVPGSAGQEPGQGALGLGAGLCLQRGEQLYRGGGMQAESVKRQSSGGGAGTLLGSAQGMDESLSGAADPRVLPRSWCPALVLHLLCWEEMETHHGTACRWPALPDRPSPVAPRGHAASPQNTPGDTGPHRHRFPTQLRLRRCKTGLHNTQCAPGKCSWRGR